MQIDPKEFLKKEVSRKLLMFPGDMAGCCHYRLLIPMYGLLKANKCECKLTMRMYPGQLSWNPNAVVFSRQHKEDVQKEIDEWKTTNSRLIYDVDDNLFNLHPSNPGQKSFQKVKKQLINTIQKCDVLTVSTEPLRERYSKIHDNIRILPNQIIPQYAQLKVPNDTDKIRIGWAGTNTHVSDFGEAINAMYDLANKYDNIKFVFFGYYPKGIDSFLKEDQFEFHDFVDISKYHLKLAMLKLDIGIAPLLDNEFNMGKSNLKILEYGLFKVPTVASPVYPYKTTIKDNTDGIIVNKNKRKNWKKALENLIVNEDERRKMGENIYNKVMSEYNIYNNLHLWEDVYFN